jgi:polyphosphate glucokinase
LHEKIAFQTCEREALFDPILPSGDGKSLGNGGAQDEKPARSLGAEETRARRLKGARPRRRARVATSDESRFEVARKRVLAVDIGGTSVKILATGQATRRRFLSGPTLTPRRMVAEVKKLAKDWDYDVLSIGYPGVVAGGKIMTEPNNLGTGWVGFDFEKAFGRPVKILNDAAMQALGSYKGGKMLFLGLGTGLGSTLIIDGIIEPMELGRLPYKKGTYEDYLGKRGLERLGKKSWRRHVESAVARVIGALELDDVVIGGGNVKKLKTLPAHCREGDNANAFVGGFRMWEEPAKRTLPRN